MTEVMLIDAIPYLFRRKFNFPEACREGDCFSHLDIDKAMLVCNPYMHIFVLLHNVLVSLFRQVAMYQYLEFTFLC